MLKQITGIAAAAVLLTPPAHAAFTKCIYLNPAMSCLASMPLSKYNNTTDWDATCTDNTGSTNVEGVWRCGSQNGGTQGTTTDMLDTADSTSINTYCWCKMVIPAVSQWVFHSKVSDQGTCYGTCGRLCLEALQTAGSTAFKAAMFSNPGA